MKLKVLNIEGKETGREIDLLDDVFNIEPNQHCVYLAVKQFHANNRQGTAKSKERSEMSGSTRKLHKQKGTGGSRKGDINNPLYKGGGRVFGPKPRDYSFKLNKKVKDIARKSALSYKAKANNIIVLEDPNFETPKTKTFINLLSNLGVYENKSIMVLNENNTNAWLSSRNIPSAAVTYVSRLNIFDILNAERLIISESSVKAIEHSFTNSETEVA